MNKWFASARDLSDSESESSSDDEKKPTTQTQQTTATAGAKKPAVAPKRNYMKNFEDSSESEEEQRTVVSKSDKQLESVNAIIKDVNNHLKISDYSALMQDFEKFTQEIDKDAEQNRGIIYNNNDGVLPIKFLRVFVKIEDSVNETTQAVKDKKMNLNKTNSQQLNKLKQKIKKYLQSTGPGDNNLEVQINKFREAPVWSEDERKAAKAQQKKTDDAKKATTKKAEVKKPAKKQVGSDESSEESEEDKKKDADEEDEESYYDEEEPSGEEESSEDEEIDIFKIPREQMTPAQRRLKWVKKERLPQYLQDILNKKKTTKDTQKKQDKEAGEAEVGKITKIIGSTEKEAKETVMDIKSNYMQIDFTKSDNVVKKVKELQDERMRGKFEPKYHLQVLTYILLQIKDPRQKLEITLNLLNSLFDSAKISAQGYMNRDMWLITHDHIQSLLNLLETPQLKESLNNFLQKEQNKNLQSKEATANDDTESVEDNQNQISQSAEIEKSILPSLANFMEKLDLELLKAFQNTPHQKIDYLYRLRDENKFLVLLDQIQNILIKHDDKSKAARVAILKLDHLYFKNDSIYKKIKETASNVTNENAPYVPNGDSQQVLQELVDLITQSGSARMKIRAILYIVYHHSIHNRFKEAKEILLRTHVADVINLQDIGTQIIYNRAITQVGMAAFRLGQIEEAHDILVEICQTNKLREVLAQGISRTPDKTIEIEREELKRQVPFHMHINLHQLDCIYMITAMLLEIPNVAENQFIVNKRVISKNFKKLIDQYDQKAFILAAENYRDNLVFAAKELNRSDWRSALNHIFQIKLISKMPEFAQPESPYRQTLVFKFKEAALKAFLCRNAKSYQSFGLQSLEQQFELQQSKLMQIISKMIVRNKVQAHFDNKNALLIMDASSSEIKELQQLSLQYIDKLELMVENNERIIDMIGDGKIYSYKERTANEIQQINATKRQKQLMKQTGGLPSVGQQTQNVIIQNPVQRRT